MLCRMMQRDARDCDGIERKTESESAVRKTESEREVRKRAGAWGKEGRRGHRVEKGGEEGPKRGEKRRDDGSERGEGGLEGPERGGRTRRGTRAWRSGTRGARAWGRAGGKSLATSSQSITTLCRQVRQKPTSFTRLEPLKISRTCVMSSFAAPISPTVMRTGEVRASRTSLSTLLGMVALNSSVCRSGLICPITDRT